MCGITGVYFYTPQWDEGLFHQTIDKMTDSLTHRGPDSRGTWINYEKGIGLGHRRLAIRDLSVTGNQPMQSSCGRYWIVYNGEIYTHTEITRELTKSGRKLKGSSDTEVILEACAEWGIETAVKKLVGMFAFGIYDNELHELTLVRDRLGIKPLYWGKINNKFVFASELKALRFVKDWRPILDRNALGSFMRHNYIPAPYTIYENIFKLEPGCILKVKKNGEIATVTYWDFMNIVEDGIRNREDVDEEETLNELNELVGDAVKRRMVSDVPIGALLSGGIDSSLVTALMAEQSERPIHTFSIGFKEKGFNEAVYASKIAGHLHTNHTELYAEPKHALDMIDKIPQWYDEPFADSSQLPTLLLSELTKQHVTVVLSGDGGDELFAGYNRYLLGLKMWKHSSIAPRFIRSQIARFILAQPVTRLDKIGPLLPASLKRPQIGSKIHKYANTLVTDDADAMYINMISHWHDPDSIVIGSSEYKGVIWDREISRRFPDMLDRMQVMDTLTYLPDDILTKIDRASMSVSLETRVPLLDHRLLEMAWGLPQDMKIRHGESKWALRQLLYKRVPRELIDRPKMGFGVPFDQWMRGPLLDWTESLLNRNRLKDQGLFFPEPVISKWEKHKKGENWGYPLWNVLMAQQWIQNNPDVAL